MEREKTIFDYIGQVFVIFGGTIVILNVFCLLFGESAQNFSTMFSMGSEGLSVATMMQFLLVSVLITFWRFLFFTDKIVKNLSLVIRTVGMFITVVVTIVLFVILFGWFPIGFWQAWLGFFVSFVISVAASVGISVLKEKAEDEKMAKALARLKEEV